MNKFTHILEKNESKKYYKVKADIDLSINADNEGEASYIADSTLASIDNQSGYNIRLIDEITKEEFSKLNEDKDLTLGDPFGRPFIYNADVEKDVWENWDDEKKMKTYWETLFGYRTPNTLEKMEFYHKMRANNIDRNIIYRFITTKNKKQNEKVFRIQKDI